MAITRKTTTGFSTAERQAMKDRAKELKAGKDREAGETAVREKIAAMPDTEAALAARIRKLVTEAAPMLVPRTYYGMPAYAKDGKVLCFFKPASKFTMRYSTFGFNDVARLDDSTMWPTEFALTALGPDEEKRVVELVRRAVA